MLFHHDCFKQIIACLGDSQETLDAVKLKLEEDHFIQEHFTPLFEKITDSTVCIKEEKDRLEDITNKVVQKESQFEKILHEIRFDVTGEQKDEELVQKIKVFVQKTNSLIDLLNKIIFENTRLTKSETASVNNTPLITIEKVKSIIIAHQNAISMIESLREESIEWAITFKDHKEEIHRKVKALEDEIELSKELVRNFNSWV